MVCKIKYEQECPLNNNCNDLVAITDAEFEHIKSNSAVHVHYADDGMFIPICVYKHFIL